MNNAATPGMTRQRKRLLWRLDGPARLKRGRAWVDLDRAFGQASAMPALQWIHQHHRGRAVPLDGGVPCLAWGGSVLGRSRQAWSSAKASSHLSHAPNRGACVCLGMPRTAQDAQFHSLAGAMSVGEVRTSTVACSGVSASGCQAFRERPVRSRCQRGRCMGLARLCGERFRVRPVPCACHSRSTPQT